MRICFVSQEYPPDTAIGGIATATRALAHGLTELGHLVQVLAWAPPGEARMELDGSVVVHRISNPRTPFRTLLAVSRDRALPLVSRLERSCGVAGRLRRMMHCEEIDLVEFPEWGAEGLVSLLKPCRRVPMVVRLHTSLQIVARSNGQTPRGSPTFWLNTRFEGLCARRASALFSPSRALAVASARDMGFDPGRVHVVPAPVDADMFTPGPAPADSAQRPVILYVGRIEWRKGVQLFPRILAEVVQRFPGAILELIGADTDTAPSGGSMREYLLNAVPPGLRQHLVFRGAVPRQDLISHYRRSAVCVFPSVFENFPNTCLEAMACGRPVVGTRSGGMEEMIESGRSGLLMPPENPGQLGAAILSVLANREWGESLGQAARRRVETAYTRATVSRVMAQCFESIITHTPCRPHGL